MQSNEFKDSSKFVFSMSLPIFVELMLQLLVGNIDQIMISRYSQASVAAIGNGNQIITLVIIVLNVMAAAAAILVSRYLGAREPKRVTQVCNVSVIVIVVASLVLTFATFVSKDLVFRAIAVPADIVGETNSYLVIVGALIVVQGVYATIAAILRSHGYVREVMLVSVVMNLCNVAGNVLLINGLAGLPRLGIIGAAISTDISKLIGLALMFWYYRKKVGIELSMRQITPFPFDILRQILFVGLPSGAQETSYNLSEMFILKFVNMLGTTIVATRVYCNILSNFEYVYVMAIAQATQILVGYLVGSRQYDRINRRITITIVVSIIISVIITGVIYIFSDSIFAIFTTDSEIIALGKKIIFIEFFLEIGRSINIVLTKTLVAVGDVTFPVVIGVVCGWLVAVMGSYFFGIYLGLGLVGIWAAKALDEIVRGVLSIARLYSNAWRKKAAVAAAPDGAV